jgi:ParB family chromosome partitioning protein
MGKLDKLLRDGGANIAESMGAGAGAGGPRRDVPAQTQTSTAPLRWQGVTKSRSAIEVPITRIVADPGQPREEFAPEALERLALSLKTRGQLQPVRVRWDEAQEKYVLICGERRWRAAQIAGLETISCVVSEGPLEPADLLALQLIENCLREDLRPIEQARAFKALMERNDWSGNQLAQALGIAQPNVSRALKLLDLPEPVQEQVEQGTLTPATAYEISKIGDLDAQKALAQQVLDRGLTRDATIAAVRTAARRLPASPGGRGKGKGPRQTRKVTTIRTLKVAGCKITIENRKGLDDDLVITALQQAVEQLQTGQSDAA